MESEDIRIVKKGEGADVFHYASILVAAVIVSGGFRLVQQQQITAVFQILLPIPVIFVALRYSLWSGMGAIAFAIGLTGLLSGYRMGILLCAGTGVAAVIFAVSFLRNYSATAAVSCVTLYYVAIGIVSVYLQNVLKVQLLSMSRIEQALWRDFDAPLEAFLRIVSVMIPVISALSSAIMIYMSARIWLRIQKIRVIPLNPFSTWKLSDQLVWIFILGGILYHLKTTRGLGTALLLGLVFLYYVQGCAIIAYFLKQRQASNGLQIVTYILLFMQIPYIFVSLGLLLTGYTRSNVYLPLLPILLVTGLGLANGWLDFRKRPEQA
jgi:uncharacterized protein YybS (DUF2232 family)